MSDVTTAFAATADQVESRVRALWREVFEDEDVGADDDFFELGGYSMLAVQLETRVQEETGVEVSFTDRFDAPTARGMSALIDAARMLDDHNMQIAGGQGRLAGITSVGASADRASSSGSEES